MLSTVTLTMLQGNNNGSGTPISAADEKYRKRRQQKSVERVRQTFMLFGISIIVLLYTWYSLFSIPEQSQSDAYRPKTRTTVNFNSKSVRNPAIREFVDTNNMHNTNPINAMERLKQRRDNRRMKAEEQQQQQQQQQEQQQQQQGGGAVGVNAAGTGGILNRITNFVGNKSERQLELEKLMEEVNESIRSNHNIGIRWANPELLPPLHPNQERPALEKMVRKKRMFESFKAENFFHAHRMGQSNVSWEMEAKSLSATSTGPKVDFTKHSYEYPEKLMEPPATLGDYPKLTPLKDIMNNWPQDDIDNPPMPFKEVLIHFDYNNPKDMEAARKFRDAKLPFKLINVPEVVEAGKKWTDEYVSKNFDGGRDHFPYPVAKGTCQESVDNFFSFFIEPSWDVEVMGIPPTRNNDYTFAKFSEHARYADATGLNPHQPHFYWQSGVDREERHMDYSEWTFISRDLPSFSSPDQTFFVFEPESQKGIQCRFGERGVTAATHYDAGRNMIAMITGAKRYIISPPKECSKLGLATQRGNAVFRHSILNFGHLNHLDKTEMPQEEREWLERAGQAMTIDTVLKAGEVMYLPSHWFHYITSLQKSAQCNVRSGVDREGDHVFGGYAEVSDKCF